MKVIDESKKLCSVTISFYSDGKDFSAGDIFSYNCYCEDSFKHDIVNILNNILNDLQNND